MKVINGMAVYIAIAFVLVLAVTMHLLGERSSRKQREEVMEYHRQFSRMMEKHRGASKTGRRFLSSKDLAAKRKSAKEKYGPSKTSDL